MDIWYYFACHLFDCLTNEGNLTFIATNNWVTNSGASKLRNKIASEGKIIQLIDFGDTKVFSSVGIQTMILLVEKSNENEFKFVYKRIDSKHADLSDSFNMLKGIENSKYTIAEPFFKRDALLHKVFVFNNSKTELLLQRIKSNKNFKLDSKNEVASGIDILQDFVNKKHKAVIGNVEIGDGIFNLSIEEFESLNLSDKEKTLLKPFYTTNELKKYYGKKENKYFVIYTDSTFKDEKKMREYPSIKKHLDKFKKILTSVNKPYGLHRSRNEYFFTGEKIFSLRKCSKGPSFTYTDFDAYVNRTFIIIKSDRINLKYLTALLNSALVTFWLRFKGKMQGFNFQIDKEPILEIPIYKPDNISIFEIIVDYIIYSLKVDNNINPLIPNSHIAHLFEEVIDAMVMELYFKEDFEKAGIEFIKYAERDFESIEGKPESEQIKIIHRTYQRLREKDNEIRNNLKLLDIKLADIVMPIKGAK